MAAKEPVFVFLQRNPRGGLTREARTQAEQLAPAGFEFKQRKSPDTKILKELQEVLPENVLLPSKGNPFTVLKITPVPPDRPQECKCECGRSRECGGGGGGGGRLV